MSSSDRPEQVAQGMPRLDQLRLDMVALVYAAAVGYGFAVFDAPTAWAFPLGDWTKCWATVWSHWPGLVLYFWVFVVIGFDWLFIRRVYYTEGGYGIPDFVLDILIVFFFVRMMHAATDMIAIDPGSLAVTYNFSYWWWLGLVFVAYVVWDLIRVWNEYNRLVKERRASHSTLSLGDRAGMVWSALRSQTWNLIPDNVFLAVLVAIYLCSPYVTQGWLLGIVVVVTLVGYAICGYIWWLVLPPKEGTPTPGEFPQIDRLRLEMVTFIYAAAVAYGFFVLDSAPWLFEPSNCAQCLAGFVSYWPGLCLYLWVFLMLAIDWISIRQVYEFREKVYSAPDFAADMLVVFCFVRMLHDGARAIDKAGAVVDFSYWWWLLLVFVLYVIWDLLRVQHKYHSLPSAERTWLKALASQKWSLSGDVAGLVLVFLACLFAPQFKDGIGLVLLVLAPLVIFVVCARMWKRDNPDPLPPVPS